MNNKKHKKLTNSTIWLHLDQETIKQRIKKIAEQLTDKNYSNPNIWLSIDSGKVKERINNITAKLEEVRSPEEH